MYKTGNAKMDAAIQKSLVKDKQGTPRLAALYDEVMEEKENKYHVAPKDKRTLDGIVFASKKEMEGYQVLKLRQRAGQIEELACQVHFNLQAGFMHPQYGHIKPIDYIADFVYRELSGEYAGKIIVRDEKGMRTSEYKLKRKLFLHNYPEYIFIEV